MLYPVRDMLYPVRGMYNPEGICITGADFTNEARDKKKQLFANFLDRWRPISDRTAQNNVQCFHQCLLGFVKAFNNQ